MHLCTCIVRSMRKKQPTQLCSFSPSHVLFFSCFSPSLPLALAPSSYICHVFNCFRCKSNKPEEPQQTHNKCPGPGQLDHWPKTQEQPTVSEQLRSASHGMCIQMYLHNHTGISVYINIHVYAHAHMYIYIHINVYIYIRICDIHIYVVVFIIYAIDIYISFWQFWLTGFRFQRFRS